MWIAETPFWVSCNPNQCLKERFVILDLQSVIVAGFSRISGITGYSGIKVGNGYKTSRRMSLQKYWKNIRFLSVISFLFCNFAGETW